MKLSTCFFIDSWGSAFAESVYPNRRRTFQISDGLSSRAGRRGPGCASDRHIRGVLARVSRPGILILAFMISTFNCAPETRSKHARPVCVFHDMLWSRVSSCGLLALEEVVSVPDICNVLSRLFWGDKQRSGKDGPNPFGDFRGRPH